MHQENLEAVRAILPAYFNHMEESSFLLKILYSETPGLTSLIFENCDHHSNVVTLSDKYNFASKGDTATIYILQTEEDGTEYHTKVFHHCTEVMKLVQVNCVI